MKRFVTPLVLVIFFISAAVAYAQPGGVVSPSEKFPLTGLIFNTVEVRSNASSFGNYDWDDILQATIMGQCIEAGATFTDDSLNTDTLLIKAEWEISGDVKALTIIFRSNDYTGTILTRDRYALTTNFTMTGKITAFSNLAANSLVHKIKGQRH